MLSNHIPLVSNKTEHPFLKCNCFKIWTGILENSMSKPWVRSKLNFTNIGSNILSTEICFLPCQAALTFLPVTAISKFDPWKSKVKVMGEVKVQCHIMFLHPINMLSTHIPFVPCQSTLPLQRQGYHKIWLWQTNVKFWMRSNFKFTLWVQYSFDSHPFHPPKSALPFRKYGYSKFDLENLRSRS